MTLVMADIRTGVHDAVHSVEDLVSRLTALDLALLVLVAAVVTWVWLALRALTHLGPIQVVTITHDDKDSAPDVEALTALMREQLAENGLSAGASTVPGGAPTGDVISAIAKSDIPQVGWVAKLLDALPRPQVPTYTLSATMLRVPTLDNPRQRLPRLRFWLEAQGGGAPLHRTVDAKSSEHAVTCAVAEILAHISTNTPHVFAPWARWRDVQALKAYMKGTVALGAKRYAVARRRFADAATLEPTNILPRLQMANIDELDAAMVADKERRVVAQAQVLRAYLDLAMEHTELVEPRYRAGVLAAMLRPAVADVSDATVRRVAAILVLPATGRERADVVRTMKRLGLRESGATFALLRVWYVLLSRQRLRYQHELRGDDRRELLQTVRISRHCMAARRGADDPWWATMPLRSASIRFVQLGLLRGFCGWQAYYNAGCFYSLVAGQTVAGAPQEITLRKRAHRLLLRAVEESGGRLRMAWMIDQDPDLATLRAHSGDAGWLLLVERADGTRNRIKEGYPASAWLYPRGRGVLWGLAGIVAGTWLLTLIARSVPNGVSGWALALTAVALLPTVLLYRAVHAYREVDFDGPPG